METVHLVGFIPVLIFIITILVPLILIYAVYKMLKKREQLAEERLKIEKQQTLNLQKRVDELSNRVIKIESLLREVE